MPAAPFTSLPETHAHHQPRTNKHGIPFRRICEPALRTAQRKTRPSVAFAFRHPRKPYVGSSEGQATAEVAPYLRPAFRNVHPTAKTPGLRDGARREQVSHTLRDGSAKFKVKRFPWAKIGTSYHNFVPAGHRAAAFVTDAPARTTPTDTNDGHRAIHGKRRPRRHHPTHPHFAARHDKGNGAVVAACPLCGIPAQPTPQKTPRAQYQTVRSEKPTSGVLPKSRVFQTRAFLRLPFRG